MENNTPKGKWGGVRAGQGRPSKKNEEELIRTIRAGLAKVGGEEALWKKIISGAMKGNTNDKQMLVYYLYGKPTERIQGTISTEFIKPLIIGKAPDNNNVDRS